MNAFNSQELQNDTEGLLESCDNCNALIVNWEVLTNCTITFDGKIICRRCAEEMRAETIINKFVKWGEVVEIEVDIDAETAKVLPS